MHSSGWSGPKKLTMENRSSPLVIIKVDTFLHWVVSIYRSPTFHHLPNSREEKYSSAVVVLAPKKLTIRDGSSLLICSIFLNDLCHINLVGATHRCFTSQTTEKYSTHFSGWRRKTYYARRVITGRYYAANWFFRRGGCMR